MDRRPPAKPQEAIGRQHTGKILPGGQADHPAHFVLVRRRRHDHGIAQTERFAQRVLGLPAGRQRQIQGDPDNPFAAGIVDHPVHRRPVEADAIRDLLLGLSLAEMVPADARRERRIDGGGAGA